MKSKKTFIVIASFLPVSLFLTAGYLTFAVALFLIYTLFNCGKQFKQKIKANKLLLLPALLFTLDLIWILFAENSNEAVTLVIRKLPLLFIPLGFILVDKQLFTKDVDTVLGLFLLGCLLVSMLCYSYAIFNIIKYKTIISPAGDHTMYYFSYDPLVEPFGFDAIYLSMFCNLAFISALTTTFIKNRLMRNLIALYLAIFIILIASKIGILTLIFVTVAFTLSETRKKRRAIIIALAFISLFALGIYKLPFLRERFITSTDFNYSEPRGNIWNSNTFRIAIWSCAAEAVKRSPLLGYGTGGGQQALENVYKERGFIWGLEKGYHPHNEFLTPQLDLGILGLLVLLMTLLFPLIQFIKTREIIYIGWIMIIFLSFSIESVLDRQKGIVFFSFFYSLFLSKMHSTKETSETNRIG